MDFVVRLSTEDLKSFGQDAIQVQCKSAILVKTKDTYHKLPITDRLLMVFLQQPRSSQHVIPLQFEEVGESTCFTMPKQPHDPLNHHEARDCLHDLVQEMYDVISRFRQDGWAHQDIRLDNICFTKEFRPILIDLDRVCRVTGGVTEYDTCMYKAGLSPSQIDWIQLGWLAAWAYCSPDRNDNYHQRRFADLLSARGTL